MPCKKHEGGKRICASCQVSSYEVSDISHGDCLQHCKLLSADFSRLGSSTGHWLVPFISVPRYTTHKNSAIFGGGSVGSGGSVAANAATFSH